MSEKAGKEYPEVLTEIASFAAEFAETKGLPPETALQLGHDLAEHIREIYGGSDVYFPKGVSYVVSQRDARILAEYDGRNIHQVCQKYGLTLRRMRQIIFSMKTGAVVQLQLDTGE